VGVVQRLRQRLATCPASSAAVTGFIIQYGGGYGSSFVLAGLVASASAIAVMCFVRDTVGPLRLPPVVTATGTGCGAVVMAATICSPGCRDCSAPRRS